MLKITIDQEHVNTSKLRVVTLDKKLDRSHNTSKVKVQSHKVDYIHFKWSWIRNEFLLSYAEYSAYLGTAHRRSGGSVHASIANSGPILLSWMTVQSQTTVWPMGLFLVYGMGNELLSWRNFSNMEYVQYVTPQHHIQNFMAKSSSETQRNISPSLLHYRVQ